jgi:hypothetical protein
VSRAGLAECARLIRHPKRLDRLSTTMNSLYDALSNGALHLTVRFAARR